MKRLFTVITCLTASALFLAAQPGPHAPPTTAERVTNQVARLTTLLTLTTVQQASATTIFTTEQTAIAALFTNMQAAHTAVQAAVIKNDANAITAAATQIGALTTQQVEAQATGDAAFYAILTADQQTKYSELKSHGPGGPGGPGFHGGPSAAGGLGGPRP